MMYLAISNVREIITHTKTDNQLELDIVTDSGELIRITLAHNQDGPIKIQD